MTESELYIKYDERDSIKVLNCIANQGWWKPETGKLLEDHS